MKDPKYLIVFLITLVLVVGEARYSILGGYDRLATTLGVCLATEVLLSWWLRGRVANLASAYITGISLALLIKPQANILWPFALGAFLAIASKYVLTYRGRHLWNPSNFAIALLVLVASNSVAILSHQWGNDIRINLVIWVFGLAVAWRARVLHVTLTYVACFSVLAVLRNLIVGGPLLAELAPITGPMYQLFVFFMVTDPRTTVSTRRGRIIVVAVVAVVESLIRLAGDFQVPLLRPLYVSPPILALAIVGPIAMYLDLRRAGGRADGRLSVPAQMVAMLAVAIFVASCGPARSPGEKLARTNCAVCHAFPEPKLLDKRTWQTGVLPQMAPRLGVSSQSLFTELSRSPYMTVLTRAVPGQDWEKIVRYYVETAPDSLPDQSLPAQPQLDPNMFTPGPFVPRLQSTGIITLLAVDQPYGRIFVGEAGSNRLMIFDGHRRLSATLALGSPPTGVIAREGHLLVLESGILDPNDEPRGSLVEFDVAGHDSVRFGRVLIDSLFRPVFVEQVDFDGQGRTEFLICEYGDNRGRLALYRAAGATYERQVLDPTPGAIRFEIHDLTGDGHPDIVALFAQADERIVLFANDGKGNFPGPPRILARFPPVYGSMHFSMHDFNGDGKLDILYVNGDNFDFSRVLKPYHGIRILENDGHNNFVERYFFPIYGAAQAQVADFDNDGDLDIVSASNFAASAHPERGIMLFENTGPYTYKPFAFSIAAGNQWNVMATGDLNGDGRPDVLIGAMHLESIGRMQRKFGGRATASAADPILFFENNSRAGASSTGDFAVRSPAAGDTLVEGRTYTIRWSAPGRRINLGAAMGGHDKGYLLTNAPAGLDSLVWTVPVGFVTGFGPSSSNQIRLRLENADSADQWVETGPFVIAGHDRQP